MRGIRENLRTVRAKTSLLYEKTRYPDFGFDPEMGLPALRGGPPRALGSQRCWKIFADRSSANGQNARDILHFSHLGAILLHLVAHLAHLELAYAHLGSS